MTDQDPERLRRSGAYAPHGKLASPPPGVPDGGVPDHEAPGGTRAADAAPARGQRRPLDPWKATFVLLALAGIVAGVAWALLGSRFLVVRSVKVTGLHRVGAPQVLAAAAIPMGLPLIRVDTQAVARRVETITQVQSARVSRSWPDGIVINVTERTPALAVADGADGGRYDLVDGAGVVVATAPHRPPGMPLLRAAVPLQGNPAVAAAVAVVHELSASLSGQLRAVSAPDADDVTLRLASGITIVWGSPGEAAVKERVLTVLMRTHARYYDVSSPAVATTR